MEKPPSPADEARKSRSDGVQSRERLLLTAMRLFAEQGFARTSTREIALAAGTNVASISYYFGDKAGLYRAAFTEPAPCPRRDTAPAAPLPLREALTAFYAQLLAPLKQGDLARLAMRMWYREMLEPTGLWEEEIDNGIKPAYADLVQVLERHLQAEHDDDLSRLAFAIVGMATHLMVARDVIDQIRPQLLGSEAAIDSWLARLVDDAEALVAAEQRRRSPPASPIPSRKKTA
ncbi:CerR family C-terminal domain-containing protein [Massilia sp. PAMC28688]|uniref:CerR family C-terminal domain-containing protein n=1 Tax=Massilia sp. PAMC28688 TaxID=2861283 RepID=UPI001C62FA49|nr:CerR family C-terminal domain-containing protein [Massilia sp. PAMC28688]QYF91800.1 CerR family C-terminal domain-containing protein [Massilia sp. PAMC28688]